MLRLFPCVFYFVCLVEVPHYGVNQVPMPVQVPPATAAPPLNDHMLDDAHSSSSSSSPMPVPVAVAEAPGFHHHQHHPQPHPHRLLPAPLALRPSPSPVAGATPAARTPPLVNGSGPGPLDSHPLLDSSQESCDGEIIGDDLDDLLDQAGPTDLPLVSVCVCVCGVCVDRVNRTAASEITADATLNLHCVHFPVGPL